MFAKKFLSIVSLLFVGRQLVTAEKVAAPTIVDGCGGTAPSNECTSGEKADTYCYHGKKLYGTNNSSSNCLVSTLTLTTGVIVVKLGDDVVSENLSGDISEDIAKIAIYNCNDDVCERSYGYIKDNGVYYYYIGADNQNEKITPTGDSCSGIIGTLDANNALCLGYDDPSSTVAAFGEKAYYLLSGTTSDGNPFTADSSSYNIPIQRGTNYMIKDTLLTEEVYSQYGTNKLIERKENFCSGTILNTYYNCADGDCTLTPNTYIAGTYLIDGSVYLCDSSSCSPKNDVNGLQAFNYNCENDKTYAKLIGASDFASLVVADLPNVFLYECTSGVCEPTSGYIKYGISSVAICSTSECEDNVELSLDADSSNTCKQETVGGFDSTNNKLCIHKMNGDYDYLEISNTNSYYVSVDADQTAYVKYTYSGNLIGVNELAKGNYIIADNALIAAKGTPADTFITCDGSCTGSTTGLTAGYYLNAGGNKIISCTGTGASSCQLYDTIGYYKNGDVYMKCNGDNCEKLDELAGCSTDTIGDLTSGQKLCLANGIQSGTFDSTVAYYLVNYRESNLFSSVVTSGTQYGIIKVDANSMTLATDKNGVVKVSSKLVITETPSDADYTCNSSGMCTSGSSTSCVVTNGSKCSDSTYYLVTASEGSTIVSAKDTPGYLYYCEKENSPCTEKYISGYYIKSNSEIYSCNGTEGECHKIDLVAKVTGCTADTIGKLFIDNDDEVSLCLTTGVPAKVKANGGRFIIGKAAGDSRNVFGLTTHGLVTISDTEIVLETNYDSPLKYVYVNKNTNEILVRGKCPSNSEANVDEYNCVKETGLCSKKD